MEEIRDIINSIVIGCSKAGIDVPEVLAAFVARTVVESNSLTFILERKLTPELQQEAILLSIEKLLERDNPKLETMKMQVDYDSSFFYDDNEAQKILRSRHKMLVSHKALITDGEIADANDFEGLTALYRKLFRFLLDFAPNTKARDRVMEREVAAALESVFPRVGLKAFIQLSKEEKTAQIMELARIVLGIRLFNKDQGRGGAGLDNMNIDSNQLAMAMVVDIDREVEFFTDACAKYQRALVRAHLFKRRKEAAEEKLEEDARSKVDNKYADVEARNRSSSLTPAMATLDMSNINVPVNDYLLDRWAHELANRRQYLSFLRTLQDEIHALQTKITVCCDSIRLELNNLTSLVTRKSSVPKEVVYPRFDSLGNLWVQLFEEVTLLTARSNTFKVLCKYRLSFNPTLIENFYSTSGEGGKEPSLGDDGARETALDSNNSNNQQNYDDSNNNNAPGDIDGDSLFSADEKPTGDLGTAEDKHAMLMMKEDNSTTVTANGATLLSVHNTPDFMLLPLELQGFCPWTIIHARGLLIPGKPALGVIRYNNLYFVCDQKAGLQAFMNDPEFYLNKIKERAIRNPEFIHLLRLQQWFPKASIAKLLEQAEPDGSFLLGRAATRDVGTSTPTHFVEKYIDINYHWNEWELRRRALKVVNLQSCATTGIQTDSSHYRRDNDTQVYEQREKDTQTTREKGTNPPIVTTYIAGLRGKIEPSQGAVSKFVKKSDAKDEEHKRARVVTLKLDL